MADRERGDNIREEEDIGREEGRIVIRREGEEKKYVKNKIQDKIL